MIIKKKKRGFFVFAIIFTILAVSLISSRKGILKEELYNAHDLFLALDLGISSLKNISEDTPPGVYASRIIGLAKKTPEIIIGRVRGFPQRPPLQRMDIDIKYMDYQSLLDDRKQAVLKDFLYKSTKVKANIRFQGEQYKSEVRLKGNLVDHWRSRHRMSLRVSIKSKDDILGYRKFSLHKPASRQYPFDHVFQSAMKSAGNLVTGHQYIRVFVNGENWGIMDMEEHMSKELLEKQKRKDSIIVKFGNDAKWHYNRLAKSPYPHYRLSDPRLSINLYSQKKYVKSRAHREWFTYLAERRLIADNYDLYDIDNYARLYIMVKAWNNAHPLGAENTRHYFNPYTLKLEPISSDQASFYPINEAEYSTVFEWDVFSKIIRTKKFKENIHRNYIKVQNALKDIDDEIRVVQNYFPLDRKINSVILRDNLKILSRFTDKLVPKLANNTPPSSGPRPEIVLPSDLQAMEFPKHLHIRHYEDGKLEIFNLLPDTVRLDKITVDNDTVIKLDLKIPGYLPGDHTPYTLKTRLKGIHDDKIFVETVYRKNRIQEVLDPTFLKGVHNPLLKSDTRLKPEFLRKTGERTWKISKGVWNIDEPIVVHGDLSIDAGAEIFFSENASLIIIGSLQAIGASETKIIFGPTGKTWQGIYVIGDGKKSSTLDHVIVKSASALDYEMLHLTGGVTFYSVDVLLQDVHFENSYAEDALNLVNSSYLINRVRFDKTLSDAFDSDFSSGKVIDSVFNDIGGDALDFAGSKSHIQNATIYNVRDKAISVGEESNVTVDKSNIDNVDVGIASKDGSKVFVTSSSISNYTRHAVMTYVKKGFYKGQPSIELSRSRVDEGHPFSRQALTRILVDGVEITAMPINE